MHVSWSSCVWFAFIVFGHAGCLGKTLARDAHYHFCTINPQQQHLEHHEFKEYFWNCFCSLTRGRRCGQQQQCTRWWLNTTFCDDNGRSSSRTIVFVIVINDNSNGTSKTICGACFSTATNTVATIRGTLSRWIFDKYLWRFVCRSVWSHVVLCLDVLWNTLTRSEPIHSAR